MRISAIVPSIPTPKRQEWLALALRSIAMQSRQPDEVLVRIAHDKMWLGDQRDHMLAQATGDFIATLDDDDWWYTDHLKKLEACQQATDADVVFSWYDVIGGTDPHAHLFGVPFDNANPHQTTCVVLVRTEAARAVGGWSAGWDDTLGIGDPGTDEFGNRAGEDFQFIIRLAKADAKIVHLPERTWAWRHHFADEPHTMGLPSRWQTSDERFIP